MGSIDLEFPLKWFDKRIGTQPEIIQRITEIGKAVFPTAMRAAAKRHGAGVPFYQTVNLCFVEQATLAFSKLEGLLGQPIPSGYREIVLLNTPFEERGKLFAVSVMYYEIIVDDPQLMQIFRDHGFGSAK